MKGPSKLCTHCGDPKSFDDFAPRYDVRDGRQSWCKECTKKSAAPATRRWRQTTRGRLMARLYDARRREAMAKVKEHRERLLELIAECQRQLAAMDQHDTNGNGDAT